jgi:arylsulfatase A
VNWPAQIKTGSVNSDLISSTDFLPTICQAAGIETPQDLDGVSFLPQLKGENGDSREWLYSWYSPRQRLDLTVKECVFDHHFKLYRTGEFFDLTNDPEESNPLVTDRLDGDAAKSAAKLKAVLDQFTAARPEELDQAFSASGASTEPARRRNRNRRNQNQNQD